MDCFQGRISRAAADQRDRVIAQIIFRTLLIVAMMAGLLAVFIWFSAGKADELSIARQQRTIGTVLEQNFRVIAHEQEEATFWDESVRQLRASQPDAGWIDENMGIWFHDHYGHDEVFIVDDAGRPIYAMRGGRRADPAAYARAVSDVVVPQFAQLRAKMREGAGGVAADRLQTPGVVDLGKVNGRPAIISAKPVVSDTGNLPVERGREAIHVSVRYIDGSFAAELASRYQLEKARFAWTPSARSGLSQIALRSQSGRPIGYFVWEPYRPGTAMLMQVAPALAVALLIMFAIVAWLLRRISHSMMQLSAARSHALHLADHDPLTSLANRALFDRRLGGELAKIDGGGRSLALLYVDLDHFKNVNDHLGHPTGDQLIQALGRLLTDVAPEDVVARLGGDEFAIIHLSDDAVASAGRLARDIHRALARPVDLGSGEVLIGASIGIAVAPRDGVDPVELVRKADIALYDAKHGGRRRHSFFTAEMGDRIRDRNEIEADLREAMRTGDGLDIVYQPYFRASSGALAGAEALIRWSHPRRGAMLPEQFIPIAEECGLIETLNEWVLEQACFAAARWPGGKLSVNLSAVQLGNATLAERVYAIMKRTRLTPSRLELEITETSFLESSAKCRGNLGWLRDIGVQIALDDFGTGYSSFRHLGGFEVDRIKIDQSFVSTIQPGQSGSPVIQAIVDLARLSGLDTTAEGIETEQQRLFLTSIGCDVLQGFLLAEPLSAVEIEARFFEALAQ